MGIRRLDEKVNRQSAHCLSSCITWSVEFVCFLTFSNQIACDCIIQVWQDYYGMKTTREEYDDAADCHETSPCMSDVLCVFSFIPHELR